MPLAPHYATALLSPLLAQRDGGVSSQIDGLGPTPYVVLAAYLLLLLVLGIFGWIKSKAGEEDYYLAGREQGWLVSSLTIMATFFSSFALLGAPGMVYREGVVFALFSLNVPVAGLCVYLLGSRIWRIGRTFGFVTPGDMVADYYGSRFSLRLLVALIGFMYAIPYVVMQIQAGGVISEELFGKQFGEWTFTVGAVILAAITMVYIMIGGMRSVAWTDMVQGLLLIGGMLVGGFAMFLIFGGPIEFGREVLNSLPEASQTAPGNTGRMWPTVLLTICIFGSTGSMVQPAQWMRYYSASSANTLRRAAMIFAVVLTTCFILGVMLIGLAGQVLYPLNFSYSEPVAAAPVELTGSVPDHLKAHFSYAPPEGKETEGTVRWSWPGKDKPQLSNADLSSLAALGGENVGYQKALVKLQQIAAAGEVRPDVAPHKEVEAGFDSILVVVLHQQMPRALGEFGAIFASLMIIAIMAASMSTADSNLHALSAVLTRDVYDQYVRPQATSDERVWVGRAIIVAATVFALVIVISGRLSGTTHDFLKMIAQMGLTAIAFSVQLLPVAIDMLFLRKGTGRGAAAGMAAGIFGAFLFGALFPFFVELLGEPEVLDMLQTEINKIKELIPMDGTAWGLLFNVPVFVLVSFFTRPVPAERKAKYLAAMTGK